MASRTQQQQQQQQQQQHQQQQHQQQPHQQQQQQQQQKHEHLMQQHHHHHQQQNHQMQFAPNHASTNFDPQQQQQQPMHQHSTMSPNAAPQMPQMPVNLPQGHIISMNPHQQSQSQPQPSQQHQHHHQQPQHQHQHHHHHHQQQQQPQQTQLMGSVGGSGMIPQAPGNQSPQLQQQQQQQPKSQILPLLLSPRSASLTPNSNDQVEHEQIIDQVISLENEFSDTSAMLTSVDGDINLSGGICIPDSNQFSSSSEDLLNLLLEFDREPSNLIGLANNQLDQDERVGIENIRKQLMSCEVQSEQPKQHQQQVSAGDQPMLHASYSSLPMSNVPVSTSYAPHQHVTRISQSNPMSIVNNSPSPSWQQPQLSPYSPQPNNSRAPQMQQQQQQIHHPHHPLQQRSPVSPPATTEPSPVVKKNPLLNAQLVNTRAPSITPTRFLNNQPNVINTNSGGRVVGSPVNPSLNPQSRFIHQAQEPSNFNYDITNQQQQQHHHHQQQQQPQANPIFRTTTAATGINPGGGSLSQQVKQEIRRKVQQPKQQHQPTSLLKQLLSDDNK